MAEEGELEFCQWATDLGLNQKTLDHLAKHDLCDLKALRVVRVEALDQIKLTMGQSALLLDGISKLKGEKIRDVDSGETKQHSKTPPTGGGVIAF